MSRPLDNEAIERDMTEIQARANRDGVASQSQQDRARLLVIVRVVLEANAALTREREELAKELADLRADVANEHEEENCILRAIERKLGGDEEPTGDARIVELERIVGVLNDIVEKKNRELSAARKVVEAAKEFTKTGQHCYDCAINCRGKMECDCGLTAIHEGIAALAASPAVPSFTPATEQGEEGEVELSESQRESLMVSDNAARGFLGAPLSKTIDMRQVADDMGGTLGPRIEVHGGYFGAMEVAANVAGVLAANKAKRDEAAQGEGEVQKLRDELARMREVVEKLPKLKDGTPVTPTQEVYDRHGMLVAVLTDKFAGYIDHNDELGPFAGEFIARVADCYSTRAAAESAPSPRSVSGQGASEVGNG